MEKKNSIDWNSLSIALLLFVFTRPFFLWGLISSTFIKFGLNIIIGVLLYRQFKKTTKNKNLIILYELIFILYLFLSSLHGSNLNGIIEALPISLFVCACFMNQYSMQKIGDYFMNIIITISSIGFILFFLSRLGVPMPSFGTIEHYLEDRSYTIYPFYLIQNFDYTAYFRFQSFYDEPGVVGTLFSLFFVIKKGNFKDWHVWACLIIGIFSFSFFFYSVLIIYEVVSLLSITTKKSTVVLILVLFGGFFLVTRNNPEMRTLIWERFEWDSQENKFKGDDRMHEEGEIAYKRLQGTSDYWWGLSKSEREKFMDYYQGSSSYKGVVAYNGMFFFALYVFFLAMLGWNYKSSNRDYILYLIIVVLCIYQRPNIYNVVYMFLFGLMARMKLQNAPIEKKSVKMLEKNYV